MTACVAIAIFVLGAVYLAGAILASVWISDRWTPRSMLPVAVVAMAWPISWPVLMYLWRKWPVLVYLWRKRR